ncbi:DUF6911 family protein [Pseudomonas syringae]|uniref:DUF6911 family protein n=3 Tax=Pseudomonas syringae TaxID=317 RepID=UPI000CD22CA7|nr:hypothetical protein [Pseudomonas syringae]MCF4987436.1 hypothetical protein [Pseudomonas syringae]MCF5201806.1 hypothetical protein [Pseudomonas syringae]MCF5272089.1 hypothetical protein [Pseudomonas syringae]MCF5278867.1 hypothetical protein [Pseudomonas syringae]MCF5283613.1 hypothetical protein [Pseudomonas syringae]
MSMIFGGYIIDSNSGRHQLEVVVDPEEFVVRDVLSSISKRSGVITMRRQLECEGQPYELVLYVESGNFLLMLSEYGSDGEHDVRTLTALNSKNEFVSILGDMYPVRSVTRDLELVYTVFIEFARTGNVSKDTMA